MSFCSQAFTRLYYVNAVGERLALTRMPFLHPGIKFTFSILPTAPPAAGQASPAVPSHQQRIGIVVGHIGGTLSAQTKVNIGGLISTTLQVIDFCISSTMPQPNFNPLFASVLYAHAAQTFNAALPCFHHTYPRSISTPIPLCHSVVVTGQSVFLSSCS